MLIFLLNSLSAFLCPFTLKRYGESVTLTVPGRFECEIASRTVCHVAHMTVCQSTTLHLVFNAYANETFSPVLLFRHFNLRMKRDTAIFPPDLIIEVSGEETPIDTSHIYSGELFGKSSCFLTQHPGRKRSFFKGNVSLITFQTFQLRDNVFIRCLLLCLHEQSLGSFSQALYGLLYICVREKFKGCFSPVFITSQPNTRRTYFSL